MANRIWAALAVVALGVGLPLVGAQEKFVSGPQVGADVPGPFHPLNVTGAGAGKKKCLYCAFQDAPVAVVFARDLTPQVASLIKQIDAANVKNKNMGSFAVFCSDDEKLADKLREFAGKEKIESTILSIDNPTGPKAYNISKDADVTVIFYNEYKVESNHAFRKGELTDTVVPKVAADVSKIVK